MSNYGGRGPSPKELHEYMDKEFGRKRQQTWFGVKIKYDRDQPSNVLVDSTSNSTDSDHDVDDGIDINNI